MNFSDIQLSDKPRNFYPVDSAISIRDGDKFVTVMNDRAQAGTADNGAIQLI